MVIEVMGHKAGWIALAAGMAGGGDVILLPEFGYDINNVADAIRRRAEKGKPHSIVVVAEGIKTENKMKAGAYIAQKIEELTGIETRETALGYIQRGGAPTSYDRNLSTVMGGYAIELVSQHRYGEMVALIDSHIQSIPLNQVAGKLKTVTEDVPLVIQGRRMGICFG
jgi:6-phosphofructokinase 1